MNNLRFSIILPLPGHRGIAPDAVAGWTRRQTFARPRFEVLVVSDGKEPALEARLRPLLGTGDRLLQEPTDNFSRIYDLGARTARGEFIVLTESHVLPDSSFLDELDRFFATTSYDGACCKTLPIVSDLFGHMDSILHEEGFRLYRQEGDWRKLNVHGFALRRQTYLDAGGLPHRYDRFAEMLLSAELRDRGVRLGYAEQAVVRHYYRSALLETVEDIDRFVRGESLYRAEHPDGDSVGYTFIPHSCTANPNENLARIVRRTLTRDALLRAFWRHDATTLQAQKSVPRIQSDGYLATTLGLYWTLLRCHLHRRDLQQLDPVYRSAWETASRLSHLRFLRTQPTPRQPVIQRPVVSLSQLSPADLFGFHLPESYQGESFRWTGRVAAIRLPILPERCTVCLETHNLRQEPVPLHLRAYCNGRRVRSHHVSMDAGVIRIVLDADLRRSAKPSTLILTCNPLEPWKNGGTDRRELGVPVFQVRCEVLSNASLAA